LSRTATAIAVSPFWCEEKERRRKGEKKKKGKHGHFLKGTRNTVIESITSFPQLKYLLSFLLTFSISRESAPASSNAFTTAS
jgi:hypothetical protein